MLLDVSEWELAMAREVPGREGAPIVGIDLGAGRAWSAATAVWSQRADGGVGVGAGDPRDGRAGKGGTGCRPGCTSGSPSADGSG